MQCQFCKEDRELIKAHIIPEPFFTVHVSKRGRPKLLSNSRGQYPKKLPIGFYDPGILCGDCDRRIGRWDKVGIRLLLRELERLTPVLDRTSVVAFTRPDFDYPRLSLFLRSVLWRASISTLDVVRRVELGPYEEWLREMLWNADVGSPSQFTTVLSAFTTNGRLTQAPIMDPFKERWNGVNAYRLSFGTITAYIKVDQARLPPSLAAVALTEGKPLIIVERDFDTSSEFNVVRAIATAPQNRRAFPKSGPSPEA